jgi:predicted transcriptional regulator
MGDFHWLAGIVRGDGHIDDRHVEIYNSSPSILKKSVQTIQKLSTQPIRVKVDIYSMDASLISKWSKILELSKTCIKLRKNTSPWATSSEKLRIRVSSKKLAEKVGLLLKKELSKNEVRSFLRGLFDAEGSVDIKGYIEFKQVASNEGKALVMKVHNYLTALNISCTNPKMKKDTLKEDFYFYVKDLEGYRRAINFDDEDKQEKLNFVIDVYKQRRKPSEKELLSILRKEPAKILDIMLKVACPYYNIRYVLCRMIKNGKITCIKSGNQNTYLITRQTRYP